MHNGGNQDIPFAVVSKRIDLRSGLVDADKAVATAKAVTEECGLPVSPIFVDTFNRSLCGGDESSSKDIGSAIMVRPRAAFHTGAHVSLIHHTPVDRSDRMRGHGSLLGAVDLIVRTGRHEDGVLVEADKANDLSEKPRRAFRFESVDLECYDGATTSAPSSRSSLEHVRSSPIGRRWHFARCARSPATRLRPALRHGIRSLSAATWPTRTTAVGRRSSGCRTHC